MFRCTDCYKEYAQHPGYCDCGNDQFEEILETEYYDQGNETASYDDYQQDANYSDGYADGYDDYEEEYVPPVPKLKKRKPKPKVKKGPTMMDKIGIGVFVVCIILSIFALIFIGAGKTSPGKDKSGKPILEKDYSIPVDIDLIWDNALPTGVKSVETVEPSKILNTKLSKIDSELNAYLISLAQAIINSWNRSGIKGNGVTQMEFRIQPDGSLVGRRIYKYSGNKTLDDSVTNVIGSFTKFQTPPSTYKDDVIIISFSSNNGSLKAYYPNVKVKEQL